MYSAHAETVYPLLRAFKNPLITEAPPASAIFLDFFTLNGEERVRTVFKPSVDEEVILLSDDSLSLDDFQTFIRKELAEWDL